MMDSYIALDELQPWADNYNHGDIDAIARSIARFGYNRTCSVWQQHTVMAGNHSVLALRQLRDTDQPAPANVDVRDGAWWVPFTSCAHLSFEEARAYAIADNETARRATRNEELLARYLQAALDAGGEDLVRATAITTDDLSRLLDTLPT